MKGEGDMAAASLAITKERVDMGAEFSVPIFSLGYTMVTKPKPTQVQLSTSELSKEKVLLPFNKNFSFLKIS